MKYPLALLFFLFSFLVSADELNFMGEKDSSGGASVVCYDIEKNIRSITVLDIWEQKDEHHLKPKKVEGTPLQIAQSIAHRLNGANSEYFKTYLKELQRIHDQMKPVGGSSSLEPVKDYWPNIKPELGCKIEQLAVYKGDGTVMYDPKLWNHAKMDNFNRGALLAHEAVFYILRDHELARDSHKARTLVAYALSEIADIDFNDAYQKKIKDMNHGGVEPVEISEVVRGKIMPTKQEAEKSWEEACKTWEERVRREIRMRPSLIWCSDKNIDLHGDYPVVIGNQVQNAVIGYQVWSEGKIHGLIDSYFKAHAFEKLGLSSPKIEHLHFINDSLSAFKGAEDHLSKACEDFRSNAKKEYKHRFLYALCDDPLYPRRILNERPEEACPKAMDHKHKIEMMTKGRIIIVTNSLDDNFGGAQ